jgi:hypothetical protein
VADLKEVKSWMNFFGWTDGGSPGSVKVDADGKEIARHGDTTWIEDVQDSCDRIERARIRSEFERRDALASL